MYPYQQPQYAAQPYQPQQQVAYAEVFGRAGAEAYPMGPNQRAMLMDLNAPRFYWKQTDASCYATVTTCEFRKVEDEPQAQGVTREEFDALSRRIEAMAKEMGVDG